MPKEHNMFLAIDRHNEFGHGQKNKTLMTQHGTTTWSINSTRIMLVRQESGNIEPLRSSCAVVSNQVASIDGRRSEEQQQQHPALDDVKSS
jgi:hypothetical protein